ncbi:polysaccharide deacetylase family protein [Streptomyces scabiei]|uniref:polysaccharide deacetylase family protein n=1 Tax=Streptomyces scabiei TaxID=1930 RepID=UPI0033E99083
MSTEHFDNNDSTQDAVVVRHVPRGGTTNNHALTVHQKGTGGRGEGVHVQSENPDSPAAVVQGAGPLLQLRKADGTVVTEVGNDGSFGDLAMDSLTVADRVTAGGFVLPQHYPGRRPPYRDATRVVELFQSGHGWATSGSVDVFSNLNDTTDFVKGTQAAKVVFTGNGNLDKSGISAIDATDKAFRITLKVDDVTKLSQLNFRIGTSASNVFQWQLHATTSTSDMFRSGEWTTITFGWADVHSAAGTYSLDSHRVPSATSGFTFIRLQTVATGGNCTVHYQSVELVDNISTTFPNGVVSLVFDDSWASQWTLARPRMDLYGYRGTNYQITERVGQAGRLSMAQLRALQDNSGWEIGGHAYTTALHDNRLTSGTAQQVDDELRNLRSWMLKNGFYSDSYAYPGGNFEYTADGVAIDSLVARYFSSGRTVLTGYGASTNVLSEQWPPTRPYRLLALSGISDASGGMGLVSNLVADGGELDTCKRLGSWLILTLHDITTGSTGGDDGVITQTDFNTLIDAINSYGIPVLPVGDVMRFVN